VKKQRVCRECRPVGQSVRTERLSADLALLDDFLCALQSAGHNSVTSIGLVTRSVSLQKMIVVQSVK